MKGMDESLGIKVLGIKYEEVVVIFKNIVFCSLRAGVAT